MAPLLIFIVFIAVFWLMIIRPQQEQRRAHQGTVASLEVGQRVMTVGGLIGTLTRVDEETVGIDPGDGSELTFGRTFVRQQIREDEPELDDVLPVEEEDDVTEVAHQADDRSDEQYGAGAA